MNEPDFDSGGFDSGGLETRLGQAVGDLRSGVDRIDAPPFEPRRPASAVAALSLLVLGLVFAGSLLLWPRDSATTIAADDPNSTNDPSSRVALDPDYTTTEPEFSDQGLVLGLDSTPPDQGWTKPGLGEIGQDAVYGTQIRRLTSSADARFDRNPSSRRQIENSDGSMFFSFYGPGEYRVYDRASLSLLSTLEIHGGSEPQWHPSDPDLIRHLVGSNSYIGALTLLETSVKSGSTAVIADLTSRIQAALPTALYMTSWSEGSPSVAGNRYAWIVFDHEETVLGLVSYDLATDTVLGIAEDLPSEVDVIRGASMSPSGEFVVVSYGDATYVRDSDLSQQRLITSDDDEADLAIGADGRDAYVYADFDGGSPDAGWVVSVDLASLERIRLFQLYGGANTALTISGRGYEKPGWVVVSTFDCKNPGAWTCDKVMALELSADPQIVNLAHTYNCGAEFLTWTEAVVNRSFTRIYFNSDGGSCGEDAEIYEITVPALP